MFRKKTFAYILVVLASLNFILFWSFNNQSDDFEGKKKSLDVTIIIPMFEPFDNNLLDTIKGILTHYQTIDILIISENIPYPYPKITDRRVKFVYKHASKPSIPRTKSDPLTHVKTSYILVLPDGSRFSREDIINQLLLKVSAEFPIVVAPVGKSKCLSLDVDFKLWTLTYFNREDVKDCDFLEDSAIMFHKKILSNFSEIFTTPFYESFFIQAKINNLKLHVVEELNCFEKGKFLFTDAHLKWKHETKLKKEKRDLYERFGIKRLVTSNGQEKWFGCSKNTARCFPSVLDVPYFLLQERWTPPCCLEALRKTARHVFSTFENFGIVYWLEGGSLLGAARHNDIIPWDYDIDIGMYMTDINKVAFLKKVWEGGEKFVDDDGFVFERASEGDFFRVQFSKTNHLHVDIFPFYEKNGVMTKDTWFKTHRQDTEFPVRFLKPLRRLKFVGVDAMVPNHHRDFLEMKFGRGVIENPQYPFPDKLLGLTF